MEIEKEYRYRRIVYHMNSDEYLYYLQCYLKCWRESKIKL